MAIENPNLLSDEDFNLRMENEDLEVAPVIEDTPVVNEVPNTNETTQTSDDQSVDTLPVKEPETKEQSQEKDVKNDSTNDTDVTDVTETKDEPIDYKAFFDEVTKDYKASGKMMPGVKDPAKFIKSLQMATDYALKTSAIKPALKRVKMLDGVTDEEFAEMLDFRNRNPEVIKKALRDMNVEPIDLDMETTNYVPQAKIITDDEYDFQETIASLSKDPLFTRTKSVILEDWDLASKNKALLDPAILKAVHSEVLSGRIDEIQATVTQLKTFGNTNGLTDLELYADVARKLDAKALAAKVVVPVKQVQESNPELDAKRAKAGISTSKTSTKSASYNPAKMTDEEFIKLMDAGAEFI